MKGSGFSKRGIHERSRKEDRPEDTRGLRISAPGPAVVEHQEDRPMYLHCLLSPDGAISIGQHQDAEAVNTVTQSTQHVLDHPHEVVQQQIEQIHQVLQEQSRLFNSTGTR
ncbi:hypothetical protein E3U43_017072 [Larimichthys crocea]|uniref:Uncharacterized protein n=1 Tax=Larimichthys crocea TaxID=215358 RepID=A0ACD3QZ18_LARCR|nr:hypothetical protein E3U43_017072 [Larimichthys crocea]